VSTSPGVKLLATQIPGFDLISTGGLPLNRATLVSGTAGSAKTIFATQFLAEGIRQAGEAGVFVTLEESPEDIRGTMLGFGWDIAGWEAEGKWAFVDGSRPAGEEETLIGDYDLGGLLARIQAAVAKVGATRLAMDAVSVVFSRYRDHWKIRSELLRINQALRNLGVTSLITGERTQDYGEIGRYGVEEFVADNVVILRNVLDMEQRRRTVEILKMRGVPHRRGEFPFVVVNGRGIEIVPLSAIRLEHASSTIRVSFGNAELDRMCHGGLFRDSTILVSGPTGAGKTLLATEFAAGGAAAGERCLYLGFEESREQLFRNAAAWGRDFARLEAEGFLMAVCEYPESAGLDDRLVRIKDLLAEYRPQRLVLDTLTALGRLASEKSFRDFTIGLTAFIKQAQIPALFTAEIGRADSVTAVTERHLSTLTDSIIMLRLVEIGSQMYRSLTVLKMRGSGHETQIREFTIDDQGMHLGPAFRQVQGVLTDSGRTVPMGSDGRT
jgi:circadian clock protein KaiC